MEDNETVIYGTDDGKDEEAEKTKLKTKNDPNQFAKWWKRISGVLESKEQKAFERNGERIVKNYRNADCFEDRRGEGGSTRVMYNVLWSNVQVQKPLLFARTPKVVIERRFKDPDPIGRLAALISERATEYMINSYKEKFNFAVKSAVEDRLLPGRGQVWVRYEADFEESEKGEATKAYSEKICVDYVFWRDYIHSQARNPYEETWRAKRVFMDREKLKKHFPDCAKKVQLSTDKRKKYSEEEVESLAEAEVWEIEDLNSKKRIWISEGYKDGLLKIEDDSLNLSGFFSTPCPLLATTTTDSSYPTPDYKIYERLADEADDVTKRLSSLVSMIRVIGVHAASFSEDLKNILDLEDGQTWPSKQWMQFAESGGFKGAIDWYPFERAVEAIQPLIAYREDLLTKIDLITGIPDFARGTTEVHVTAEAEQRKAEWVNLKAREKQVDVQRFCREIIQKITELIFEPGLFSDETIYLMAGIEQLYPEDQAMWQEALALLRDDKFRTFRIDIETDSTIAIDEKEQAQMSFEYLKAVTEMIGNIQQVSEARPEYLVPITQTALSAVRNLRSGRVIEASWERAMQEIEMQIEQAKQNPEQPPPDAALLQAQAYMFDVQQKGQIQQMEVGAKNAATQQDAMEAQMKYDLEMRKLELEGQKLFSKDEMAKMEHQLEMFKQQFLQMLEAQKLEAEKYRIALTEREKLLEEERLRGAEAINAVKEMRENQKQAASSESQAKPPTIHIHNGGGSKEITMKRSPDGSLVGRSTEVS